MSDPQLGLAEVSPYFDSITPLETVPYNAYGVQIYTPTIYLGHAYHAQRK